MNKLNIVEHQRVAATIIMQEDLRRKNYTRIHVLHVNIDPDYRKLNRNRREKLRPVWGAIDSMVFYDIIDIICEEMKTTHI